MEYLDKFLDAIGREDVRAILIALVISLNGTQFVKHWPRLVGLFERQRVFYTRLIAFVLGFLPAVILYPESWGQKVMVAAAVGLASPAIYTYGARGLYHFFPWLELKMSAVPVTKDPA